MFNTIIESFVNMDSQDVLHGDEEKHNFNVEEVSPPSPTSDGEHKVMRTTCSLITNLTGCPCMACEKALKTKCLLRQLSCDEMSDIENETDRAVHDLFQRFRKSDKTLEIYVPHFSYDMKSRQAYYTAADKIGVFFRKFQYKGIVWLCQTHKRRLIVDHPIPCTSTCNPDCRYRCPANKNGECNFGKVPTKIRSAGFFINPQFLPDEMNRQQFQELARKQSRTT
jgi:hypothetical protein